MIYVDDRIGSGHYVSMLEAKGVAVQEKRLPSADLAFIGNGPGQQIMLGIEVKKPGDLVQSFMDRRLTARQIPRMARSYDICFLAIVGRMRKGKTGAIEVPSFGRRLKNGRPMPYWVELPTKLSWKQIQGVISTLRHNAKFIIIPFDRDKDFVDWVEVEYARWQRPHDSHNSHIGLRVEKPNLVDTETWMPTPPKLTTQVASLIPGIGDHTAREVGKVFSSVQELANAPVKTWENINGIGKKRAAQAYLALRGE